MNHPSIQEQKKKAYNYPYTIRNQLISTQQETQQETQRKENSVPKKHLQQQALYMASQSLFGWLI